MSDTTTPWASDTPATESEFPNWQRKVSAVSGLSYFMGDVPKEPDHSPESEWFFIAYRPEQATANMSPLLQMISAISGADIGGEKTALIWKKAGNRSERYFELNGDFRREFETAFANGVAAIVAVWEAHPDNQESAAIKLNAHLDDEEKAFQRTLN